MTSPRVRVPFVDEGGHPIDDRRRVARLVAEVPPTTAPTSRREIIVGAEDETPAEVHGGKLSDGARAAGDRDLLAFLFEEAGLVGAIWTSHCEADLLEDTLREES